VSGDLKLQERMHGRERVRTGCHDIHPAAVRRLHVLIPNHTLPLGHQLRTGLILRIVDQHRRLEIALTEHHCHVRQVGTDRVAGFRVGRFLDAHIDRTAVIEEQEVVCRSNLVEAHHHIPLPVLLLASIKGDRYRYLASAGAQCLAADTKDDDARSDQRNARADDVPSVGRRALDGPEPTNGRRDMNAAVRGVGSPRRCARSQPSIRAHD